MDGYVPDDDGCSVCWLFGCLGVVVLLIGGFALFGGCDPETKPGSGPSPPSQIEIHSEYVGTWKGKRVHLTKGTTERVELRIPKGMTVDGIPLAVLKIPGRRCENRFFAVVQDSHKLALEVQQYSSDPKSCRSPGPGRILMLDQVTAESMTASWMSREGEIFAEARLKRTRPA